MLKVDFGNHWKIVEHSALWYLNCYLLAGVALCDFSFRNVFETTGIRNVQRKVQK